MMKNENGVKGEYHPSRLTILLKGGGRNFIPERCLTCVKFSDKKKTCKIGIRPPIMKGTCKRWKIKSI